jgi:hypothetical protein
LRNEEFWGGGNESHKRRSKIKPQTQECKRGGEGGCGF